MTLRSTGRAYLRVFGEDLGRGKSPVDPGLGPPPVRGIEGDSSLFEDRGIEPSGEIQPEDDAPGHRHDIAFRIDERYVQVGTPFRPGRGIGTVLPSIASASIPLVAGHGPGNRIAKPEDDQDR